MGVTSAAQRRRRTLLILYITFLLVWSIAVLVMPIASAQKAVTKIPMFISGGGFWIGLIGTVTVAININMSRKKSYSFKYNYSKVNQVGLISFFKNKEAIVADVAMFVSLGCFIILRICADNIYLQYVFLALFVFSFGMHCMLNGKNYIYLNQEIGREEES